MDWGRQKYVALALIISVTFGAAGHFAGLPLPWVLGPMIGNTITALCSIPIRGPDRLRPIVMPVIGVMLGSSVTVNLFEQLGEWAFTLALLPVFLMIAASVSYLVYRKVGAYDPVTAFYAAMPGGLNEMLIILGAEAGADEKRIALAHAARVLIVIFFVVIFFWLIFDVTSTGSTGWIGLRDIDVSDYTILGFCAVAGVWTGNQLRLPAASVFGPMLLSGFVHVMGWVTVAPPTFFVILAQLVIGTVIGSRFVGVTPKELIKDLSLAIVAAVGMLCVAVAFAEIIVWQTGLKLSQAFLAFSPGGLTEMALLSLAMEQDVTYVTVVHLIRIICVIAIAPSVFGKVIANRT